MDQPHRARSFAQELDRFDALLTRWEAIADRLEGVDFDIVGPPPLSTAEKRDREVRNAGVWGANHAHFIVAEHPDATQDELLAAMRDHVVVAFRDDDVLVEEAMRGAISVLWQSVKERPSS